MYICMYIMVAKLTSVYIEVYILFFLFFLFFFFKDLGT